MYFYMWLDIVVMHSFQLFETAIYRITLKYTAVQVYATKQVARITFSAKNAYLVNISSLWRYNFVCALQL